MLLAIVLVVLLPCYLILWLTVDVGQYDLCCCKQSVDVTCRRCYSLVLSINVTCIINFSLFSSSTLHVVSPSPDHCCFFTQFHGPRDGGVLGLVTGGGAQGGLYVCTQLVSLSLSQSETLMV